MSTHEVLYQISDELRATASIGLRFAENGYDKERYERILHLSARIVASLDDVSPDEVFQKYSENLSHFSPLIGVEAAVFNEGRILLIQRKDNGLWAIPGGLLEVGETLSQAVLRELWEEAGINGKAKRILGIFDSRIWQIASKMHLFAVTVLVDTNEVPHLHVRENESNSSLSESLEVGFFSEDQLPELAPGHIPRVPLIFKLYRGEMPTPYFD